jgi:hypothetical protein
MLLISKYVYLVRLLFRHSFCIRDKRPSWNVYVHFVHLSESFGNVHLRSVNVQGMCMCTRAMLASMMIHGCLAFLLWDAHSPANVSCEQYIAAYDSTCAHIMHRLPSRSHQVYVYLRSVQLR